MAETEIKVLLCVCGIAERAQKRGNTTRGISTAHATWKKHILDCNPNINFTTICSFDPSRYSSKYNNKRITEIDHIPSYKKTKTDTQNKYLAGDRWNLEKIIDYDLRDTIEEYQKKIRSGFEISQINAAYRLIDINKRVPFDKFDCVLYLRPDAYFYNDLIIDDNCRKKMYIIAHDEIQNHKDNNVYFCTYGDWDYGWIGRSDVIKDWSNYFIQYPNVCRNNTKIKHIKDSDKKLVGTSDRRIKNENTIKIENYLYNFKYIHKIHYLPDTTSLNKCF